MTMIQLLWINQINFIWFWNNIIVRFYPNALHLLMLANWCCITGINVCLLAWWSYHENGWIWSWGCQLLQFLEFFTCPNKCVKTGKFKPSLRQVSSNSPIATHLTNNPPRLKNRWLMYDILRGMWPTVISSSLTTATAYVSKTFPNSGLHVKLFPICGNQTFLKIWCPWKQDSNTKLFISSTNRTHKNYIVWNKKRTWSHDSAHAARFSWVWYKR